MLHNTRCCADLHLLGQRPASSCPGFDPISAYHLVSTRVSSQRVRVGVSRTIASPSPTSGLPRRPRLDRPCIVIIHKFYSVRLSSSEGTRSRGPSEISLRVPAHDGASGVTACGTGACVRHCSTADSRETQEGGGRESDSRVEHRRGSRVGVRVFNSGAKATCA